MIGILYLQYYVPESLLKSLIGDKLYHSLILKCLPIYELIMSRSVQDGKQMEYPFNRTRNFWNHKLSLNDWRQQNGRVLRGDTDYKGHFNQ